jgi:putative transposase
MARRPRFPLTGLPLHVVQRGNNRLPCFVTDADRRFYLGAWHEAATHYRVQVHAYVLMTNHVHLLATPLADDALGHAMQSVGARYVRYFNHVHSRTGTLWEGRYKACLVDEDRYVLAVCRYIDLNPVRAGLALHPAAYRWSSHRALAGLAADPLLTPHPALSAYAVAPGPAYARWCDQLVDDEETARVRDATQAGLVLGGDAFRARVAALTTCATARRRPGRPRRPPSQHPAR